MTYSSLHAHYQAHRLTTAGADEDAFSRSLSSARVEMNPHQVDAALFALQSPFSKGVLLADEVGLGKTIEAGLVISQRWAEHRRRILLIVPASLRKQWSLELYEKFGIRSEILESKTYNDLVKGGRRRPFEDDGLVKIVSYEFAARKADDLRRARWDLVICDEAHRMRNVWSKAGAKGAKAIKEALSDSFKILLTATPLQNSLMELYGLVSIIDETHFGGTNAFKAQFTGANATPAAQQILRERLQSICHRTLRRQVQEAGHINFRQRHATTFTFEPFDTEAELYEMLSEYLQDATTIAYGGRINHLVVLQARKQLGSSTFAVAQYLTTLLDRLRAKERASADMTDDFEDTFSEEFENVEPDDGDDEERIDPVQLANEIEYVEQMRDLALSIGANAKGEKLVQNLPLVLDEIQAKGGKRKAVIFTESVRTQRYLHGLLSDNGYDGQIVLLNGSNADPESRAIYQAWRDEHAGTDRVSGSRTADMKAALVDAFRSDDKTILIATESGAEGINLQFCSLLVNFDLPWNPQRVEQRIGRCHRYGQLVDVTVVNMLNLKNRTEERILELLQNKLHLFEGVFGASDDVLGILADGIDFEREVLDIVQRCRSAEEADREFDELTAKIQGSIDEAIQDARAKVLENMDAVVVQKLQRRGEAIANIIPELERRLLIVAKGTLSDARFATEDATVFEHAGKRWSTQWKEADEHDWQFFRISDGLGAELIEQARTKSFAGTPIAMTFDPAAYPYTGRLGGVFNLDGQSGWLRVIRARMPVKGAPKEEIIVVAIADDGTVIPSGVADGLFFAPAVEEGEATNAAPEERLGQEVAEAFGQFSHRQKTENFNWLLAEEDRLNRYAKDQQIEIQAKLADLDEEIRDLNKAKLSPLLSMQDRMKVLRETSAKQEERDDLFMRQHEIMKAARKDVNERLDEMAALLNCEPEMDVLFTVRWTVRNGATTSDMAEAA